MSIACGEGIRLIYREIVPIEMAMYQSERQIGDDGDSLTEMSEACLTHDDPMCQRYVSYICVVLDQRTDLFKQF